MKPKQKFLPGLSAKCTSRCAREFVDFDYVDKLSSEEKQWLDQFSREYYQNDFSAPEFHVDKESKRELYRTNNERARDIWNTGVRDPNEVDIDVQIRTRKPHFKAGRDE